MKTLKVIFLIILLVSNRHLVSAQASESTDLTITQLGTGIWLIETKEHASMYLIEGSEKAMLIDTGTPCEGLDKAIRKITGKPIYVVLTHMHGDHTGNIRYFKDIYFHAADTVLMQPRAFNGKVHFINDGDVFDLGSKKIEVKYMPGHTPGSIILLDKQLGNCYSGDAFGSGEVWLQLKPLLPIATYISSCKKMINLMDNGITKIYCGHYYYVQKAFDKSHMLNMLELAESIQKGNTADAKPYPNKVSIGPDNPMKISKGEASIVFDPANR